MIKSVLGLLVGAVAALESERLLGRLRARLGFSTLTDGFLDRLNSRLERDRSSASL